MNLFANVQLTPADLPAVPAPQSTASGGSAGSLEFYGPGASGAHASPQANLHAEVSPVFGGDGPG